ncbi:MAG: YgiQ family radical SAM protein [Erysipelotrichaceae bacterium]|jgi:uncharacterized radical SAM protein YgiQ
MFLPINRTEMLERGWKQPDFIYVIGDAYVDHPSFGAAIISRTLEAFGYKVVILSQPDWRKDDEFLQFGKPRLGFLVTAGNIDSMVNHFTVNKKRRKKDSYSDQGIIGKRPDRATIVYCQKIRQLFTDSTIIIGGIEASLRRLAHYDYWDDKVRNSILIDSQADLLLYGMGENGIIEVADSLNAGIEIKHLTYLRGSCYKTKSLNNISDYILLPSYEEICSDKRKYAESFKIQSANTDAIKAKKLVETYRGWYIVQNEPDYPISRQRMDDTYALPYKRTFHPSYKHVPAVNEVKFSITSSRGCFGSCAFCALTNHQGRVISSRSKQSIVDEAKLLTQFEDFKGYISDIGGPTANFYQPSCKQSLNNGSCTFKNCLSPEVCPNLTVDHSEYADILKTVAALPKVKKVFVRSGIRYDYLIYDKDDSFFRQLMQHHISGQLRVAPEHIDAKVLNLMGKPAKEVYLQFIEKFNELNREYNMNQFIVPYFISSHPGSDLNSAIELALYLKEINHIPLQVQDFYPTPATKSTCMYYTGLNPDTMEEVFVEKDPEKKKMQRALLQYSYPQNYNLVYKALISANRNDLIGYSHKCLIRPKKTNTLKKY